MRENILFITKDALCKSYLPCYGNKMWRDKTPNLDYLAQHGTVFKKHYTAAPSKVMYFRAMMTGKYPFEQPYSDYSPKEVDEGDFDFFSIAASRGYQGHIVWDKTWDHMVLRYGNCFGSKTTIHSLDGIKQGVGCHYNHSDRIVDNDETANKTIELIFAEIQQIVSNSTPVVVWMHLPHVLNGRSSYGGDIDIFDKLIGKLRTLFNDNNIFISADHGNMNGYDGKYCYGFDVNTSSIEIPLITPRINGMATCDSLTSNVDIKTIIFDRKINAREVVFSETAYYAQPHRKIAIRKDSFLYVFSKEKSKEELYDVENDSFCRVNLLKNSFYDPDRRVKTPVKDYYYSPYWDNAHLISCEFRDIKNKIWINAPKHIELKNKILRRVKFFLVKFKRNKQQRGQ